MDFDTYFNTLEENIDTTNYVAKYQNFGQKLKEYYSISSHEDSFADIKMAAYFNTGILYKFYFKTINKTKTLKKINKLVNNKIFEIRSSTEASTPATVVEVVYLFKDINRMIEKGILNKPTNDLSI